MLDLKAKAYMQYLRGTGLTNAQISKKIGCHELTEWNIPDFIPEPEPVSPQCYDAKKIIITQIVAEKK